MPTADNLHSHTPGKSIEKDSEVVNYQQLLRLTHPYPSKVVAVTSGPQAGNYIFHGPTKTWLPLGTPTLSASLGEIGQLATNPLVYQFWQSPNGSLWVVTMDDDGALNTEPYTS
ncbi:hypothetical protein Q5H92_14845 [Hymenobacter sp. M29]|uniref:Uncharacterized protein n=1 Tax=Hymenobacter mellowenesis TaxID=3063995 RepID=A0ABT9ACV4_9BACT|nr:hypothetical protein [Hymenobacter sp. M29]MDO7847644.1 hypothetical protein [Hymenobacter sp. M29]